MSTAHADPVSVRCANRNDKAKDVYFVTYEIQKSRFLLESPIGNLMKGEIASATDQGLELRLKAMYGPILLFFNRQDNSMWWPGMPANEFGHGPLVHNCTTTADRTVLSLFTGPDQLQRRTPVGAFSIRCHGSLDFFITMDRSTKAVVMESEAGRTFSGEINGIDGPKISLTVSVAGKTLSSGTWNEQTQELAGNDPSHPPHSQHCIPEKARSIMGVYDRL